jgi:hypothetical protein
MNDITPQPDQPEDAPRTSPFTAGGRHRNGKVARLSKPLRDRVNNLLLDGKTYAEIIASLGAEGSGLNEGNVGEWKNGGYQEWLRQQQEIQIFRTKQEFALDLVRDKEGTRIHQATMQIAAANLCQLMLELEPGTLRGMIEKEPDKYTRLLNSIARLSDGQIKAERFAIQETEKEARLAKAKLPAQGGISEEALQAAEARLKLL